MKKILYIISTILIILYIYLKFFKDNCSYYDFLLVFIILILLIAKMSKR